MIAETGGIGGWGRVHGVSVRLIDDAQFLGFGLMPVGFRVPPWHWSSRKMGFGKMVLPLDVGRSDLGDQ